MRITTDRKAFLHLLQTVSPAVAVRPTLQTLTGILLESNERSVVATAYDLEIGIKEFIDSRGDIHIEVIQEGNVVLPAKQVIDIIRKLTDDKISIDVTPNNSIVICSGEFECTLNGMRGDTFPLLPVVSNTPSIVLSAQLLRDLIKGTAFAASKSESRPVLTGVHVQLSNNQLRFSATDSLRLATRNVPINTQSDCFDAIIPSKALVELMHVLPDDDTQVSIARTESHCVFEVNTLTFHTRIIDGTFVDVPRLIPQHWITEVVVDRSELAIAIDRASVIAPRNQEVQLTVNQGATVITTKSPEFGNLSDVIPTKKMNGQDISIAFNAKNVIEAVRTIDSQEAIVRLTGPNQPIVLTPGDGQGFVHVISPIVSR